MKVILKLGGSLITIKSKPKTTRRKVIRRIVREIKDAWDDDLKLVLIHGGGSFGHYVAMEEIKEHGCLTLSSIPPVAWSMQELNNIIVSELLEQGLPAVSFPPHSFCYWDTYSASFKCHLDSIVNSLENGHIPVTYGDIIYSDREKRPVIISGDDLAFIIARRVKPDLIAFCMDVPGVLESRPSGREIVVKKLKVTDIPRITEKLARPPAGVYDITNGIKGKLMRIKEYVEEGNKPTIVLLSGLVPRNITRILKGEKVHGTYVTL